MVAQSHACAHINTISLITNVRLARLIGNRLSEFVRELRTFTYQCRRRAIFKIKVNDLPTRVSQRCRSARFLSAKSVSLLLIRRLRLYNGNARVGIGAQALSASHDIEQVPSSGSAVAEASAVILSASRSNSRSSLTFVSYLYAARDGSRDSTHGDRNTHRERV